MSLLTFKGGIHPYDGKDLTKDCQIEEYLTKEDVCIPLSQHIGAPAEAVVSPGDFVLVGELIAKAGGFVSANIHSPVSGKIKGIEKRKVVNGSKVPCIIIENDGNYNEVIYDRPRPLSDLSGENIIELVKKAGVVGMGGAGFPTHVKLMPKEPEKIDYIIVNGAECEPYLTSDYRRMLEEPVKLVEGLKCMLKIFPGAKGIIAVEDNKPDVIRKLTRMVRHEKNIEVKMLLTKYPQGAERMLIYAVTGRKVNSKMLPADVGCIVDNVDTVCAIYSAVIERRPLISRIVTVTGPGIVYPSNFLARIGTNQRELIKAAGGFKGEPEKVISGGPMMGIAMESVDVPLTKTSSAILVFNEDPLDDISKTNCINCGRCLNVCPGGINPSLLAKICERNDLDAFVENNGMECCECGCCSYICPAKKDLTQAIKTMRKRVMAKRRK